MNEMIPYVESDLDRFVRAVLLDLDAAGALADYLDENDPPTAPYLSGKPSLSRGELLRRRWKMWKRQRDWEVTEYHLYTEYRKSYPLHSATDAFEVAKNLIADQIERADDGFRTYIHRKLSVKFICR